MTHKQQAIDRTKPLAAKPGRYRPSDSLLAFLPGSPGALLRPGPLRTGRARFHASGSSKPQRLAGWQKRWTRALGGREPSTALGMHETEVSGFVRLAVPPVGDMLLAERLLGGTHPLLPLTRALGRVVGMEEHLPAKRATAHAASSGVAG